MDASDTWTGIDLANKPDTSSEITLFGIPIVEVDKIEGSEEYDKLIDCLEKAPCAFKAPKEVSINCPRCERKSK